MKRFAVVAVTLVTGILIGSLLVGTAFAAAPREQGTPTPTVPGQGYGRGGAMGQMVERMRSVMAGRMHGAVAADAGIGDEVLALLNMTREQISAERQAGKSLVQIAQAKNVTEQQLVDTILAAKKAALDEIVAAGKLTQARADTMLANMRQSVTEAVNRTTVGPVWGNGQSSGQGNGQGNNGNCPMIDGGERTPGAGQPALPGRGGMRGGRAAGRGD